MKNYNLHTIVRLPEGTFAPYTDIPANLLFFDRSGPTDTIWYYQVPLPEGRKKFTKTIPLQEEHLAECKAWFLSEKREENDYAWKLEFKPLLEQTIAKATPHWEAAEEAKSRAKKIERQIKDLKEAIRANAKNQNEKQKLDTRLRELVTTAASERAIQAAEQSAGDAIYWPIFNLDAKNPTSAETLEQRPPEELIGDILKKEREILKLVEEIQTEVASLK